MMLQLNGRGSGHVTHGKASGPRVDMFLPAAKDYVSDWRALWDARCNGQFVPRRSRHQLYPFWAICLSPCLFSILCILDICTCICCVVVGNKFILVFLKIGFSEFWLAFTAPQNQQMTPLNSLWNPKVFRHKDHKICVSWSKDMASQRLYLFMEIAIILWFYIFQNMVFSGFLSNHLSVYYKTWSLASSRPNLSFEVSSTIISPLSGK